MRLVCNKTALTVVQQYQLSETFNEDSVFHISPVWPAVITGVFFVHIFAYVPNNLMGY